VALSAGHLPGSIAIPIQEILENPHMSGWMTRVRAHEAGLYRHTIRVARLVTEYTRFLGIPYQKAWVMIEGGLLHDLGKTLMPAAMLVKAKPLNDCEKQMMLLHPSIGAALLEAEGHFTPPVVAVVKSHHERLDGSGYPEGLRQSTLNAVRVVAVLDAFCAMTESRPYEGAWPEDQALNRLLSMPEQYDPAVSESLGKLLEAKRHGWSGGNIEIEVVSKPSSRFLRGGGLVHPRNAFFDAVYPPENSSDKPKVGPRKNVQSIPAVLDRDSEIF
jgi:putative nucleotidyltransferase with HDIG domain